MAKKARWIPIVLMVLLILGVGPNRAEEAILIEAPSESVGLNAIVAPAGGRAWILQGAEKKLAALSAAEALVRTMTFPAENTRILAEGSVTLDAPTNQTVAPATQQVTPAVSPISPTEQNGWYEFTHQLSDTENLVHTTDRLWFTSATDNTMAALDSVGNAGGGATPVHNLYKWTMPTADSGPRGIATGPDGSIWVVCYSAMKLVRLNPDSNQRTEWDFPNAVGPANPGIVVTDSNFVWIADGLGGKLHRFNPAANMFSAFDLKLDRGAEDLALDSNGNIWMSIVNLGGLEGGVQAPALAVVGDNLTWYELPLSFTDPYVIGITPFNRIWCISRTSHQIGEFDPVTRQFTQRTLPNIPSGSSAGLAIDPDGNVWFTNGGTNFAGYIPNAAHHTLWFPFYANTASLTSRVTLHNIGDAEVEAILIAHADNGSTLGTTTATLPARGKWTENVDVLFPGAVLGGMKVVSTGPLGGAMLIKDGAVNLAAIPGKPTEGDELTLSWGAMPDATPTMLILSNPGRMNTALDVTAYNNAGSLLTSLTRSLAPGQTVLVHSDSLVPTASGAQAWVSIQGSPWCTVNGLQLFLSGTKLGFITPSGW